LNKKISKKRADQYYKNQEELTAKNNKDKKRLDKANSSKSRDKTNDKEEKQGNWFTNIFMFCGGNSCCTSKATQDNKDEKSE
jgi:hypothetical protein